MSKSALGKGLGDLMNGDQVAGKSCVVNASAATITTTTQPIPGRGLTTLVSARRGDAEPVENRRLLPTWFFFAADLLLLSYVVGITFDAPRPFDVGTILFCAVSTSFGCLLGVIGAIRAAGQSFTGPAWPSRGKRKILPRR